MNLTARSEQITHEAWGYGVRIVQLVQSRKLTRVEWFPEIGVDYKSTGIAWIDKKIRVFNLRIEYGPQYPDYWAK